MCLMFSRVYCMYTSVISAEKNRSDILTYMIKVKPQALPLRGTAKPVVHSSGNIKNTPDFCQRF